ncbi:glycosyltransferase [Echinicola vietnamensis]|uniref:Glycosyl transferase n=1 Tax=Echinicola vietnamensis (strain DSM 17526 / LMG 23754 / KMM 6221) TaxID=926556 RepID=L0G1V9_ECHVK|nr:glycosyltransferase family 2 protein [Echinicola vietnamensis]AGA78976.1 glycosyl transferase [Echinicola vietnamensis DSM 17526]
MIQNNLVSIIIPSYNYGQFINKTISNLKAQSYSNWEAIIIDDGSTDDTEEVITNAIGKDKRFTYLKIKNKGNAAARNVGLDLATGDYIQFLDADDLLSEQKLEIQVEALHAKDENVISYTNNVYFKHENPKKYFPDFNMQGIEWMPKISSSDFEALSTLVINNFAVISSPLINHKFLKKNNIKFPEHLNSKVDWIFWIDCLLAGASLEYLDEPLATTLIRRHSSSITVQDEVLKFGEIHARDLIHKRLVKANLSTEERLKLISENNQRKAALIRNHFYHSSLLNIKTLNLLYKNTNPITFVKYFFKSLNYKRKQLI